MIKNNNEFIDSAKIYLQSLCGIFSDHIICTIELLANDLLMTWQNGNNVFICGNGGSAANAIHIANDLLYGVGACGPAPQIPGLRVEALSANQGIITCLANDTGYENIFKHQLKVKAQQNDLLIVLSGSGNSTNIVNAILEANIIGLKTYAITAFNGGKCKSIADQTIHFPINDMQIAEDTQLIVGHLCMQWLNKHKPQHLY